MTQELVHPFEGVTFEVPGAIGQVMSLKRGCGSVNGSTPSYCPQLMIDFCKDTGPTSTHPNSHDQAPD